VADIRESCSVCNTTFAVIFRYQMEERNGGFVFFCSQSCLEKSQVGGSDADDSSVACDACAKRFTVALASQVFYSQGKRRYACSMPCRVQLIREGQGMRLGDIAAPSPLAVEPPQPVREPYPLRRRTDAAPARESLSAPSTSRPSAALVGGEPSGDATDVAETSFFAEGSRARSTPPIAAGPSTSEGRRAPKRIAVFNHKGGTGKTTTSVNLAAGLADRGHRVLLVDTDSQGNVAVSLGAKCDRSLYHVLVMGLRVDDAIQSLRPGLDLLPANETLAAAELYLAGRQNRDRVLSQRLSAVTEAYDYVIVDCSPSLSLMNQNALVLADSVLVPVACDYLSLVGVRQVIKTVKNVNSLLRHPLQIWGVLPTFYDSRARICSEALETLRSHFGDRCLAPIRATTKLKEAPAQARSIFDHAPGTHGADDYATLVDELLSGASTPNDHAAMSAAETA
jgi:chromosome partitioning protein